MPRSLSANPCQAPLLPGATTCHWICNTPRPSAPHPPPGRPHRPASAVRGQRSASPWRAICTIAGTRSGFRGAENPSTCALRPALVPQCSALGRPSQDAAPPTGLALFRTRGRALGPGNGRARTEARPCRARSPALVLQLLPGLFAGAPRPAARRPSALCSAGRSAASGRAGYGKPAGAGCARGLDALCSLGRSHLPDPAGTGCGLPLAWAGSRGRAAGVAQGTPRPVPRPTTRLRNGHCNSP